MPETINWNDILNGYNNIYNTHFATLYALMFNLYKTQSQSTTNIDKILGLSANTINQKLRELGIPIKKPGWPKNKVGTKMRRIIEMDKDKLRNMTSKEIEIKIGCSNSYVRKIMGDFRIEYKKGDK